MATDEAVNFSGQPAASSGPSQAQAVAAPPAELREEQIANAVAFLTNPKVRRSQLLHYITLLYVSV